MKKIKNSTLLIGAGSIFLILGILYLLIVGINSSTMTVNGDELLSQDEAIALTNDKTLKVMDLYENQSKVFNIEETEEEDSLYHIAKNYDEIVKSLFSENGIKQLENSKFEDKEFVKKEEDKVYILKEIPEDNRYKTSNISISIMNIKKDSITSEVTLTSYKLKDDVVTYYVIVKNVNLVKKDNEWLINDFSYPNE